MKIIKYEITPDMKKDIMLKLEDELLNCSDWAKSMYELNIKTMEEMFYPMSNSWIVNNLDDFDNIPKIRYIISDKDIRKNLIKLYNYTLNHLIWMPNGFKYKLSKYEELLFKILSKNCNKLIFGPYDRIYIEPTIQQCKNILSELDKVIMSDYMVSSKLCICRKDTYKLMKRLEKEDK